MSISNLKIKILRQEFRQKRNEGVSRQEQKGLLCPRPLPVFGALVACIKVRHYQQLGVLSRSQIHHEQPDKIRSSTAASRIPADQIEGGK